MIENIPLNENADRILNEREVISAIEEITGPRDYNVVHNESDEKGLWKFSVRTWEENGDMVQYDYRRDDYVGETVIDVVYFMGEMPVGGEPVKKYKGGKWIAE